MYLNFIVSYAFSVIFRNQNQDHGNVCLCFVCRSQLTSRVYFWVPGLFHGLCVYANTVAHFCKIISAIQCLLEFHKILEFFPISKNNRKKPETEYGSNCTCILFWRVLLFRRHWVLSFPYVGCLLFVQVLFHLSNVSFQGRSLFIFLIEFLNILHYFLICMRLQLINSVVSVSSVQPLK